MANKAIQMLKEIGILLLGSIVFCHLVVDVEGEEKEMCSAKTVAD